MDLIKERYHSNACPDHINLVRTRIADAVGDIPVEEFIASGLATQSDGAIEYYNALGFSNG